VNLIRTIAASQSGVVTASQCREAGISESRIRTLCRDRRWLRLNEGVYLVDADRHDGEPPRAAIVRAALLSAGPHAIAVLGTAAELLGIAGLPAAPTVHVSLPGPLARPRRVTDPSVRLHQFVLPPDQTTVVDGVAVTTPARTVADVVLRSNRLVAVAVLDSSLHRRLLTEDDLSVVRGLMCGRRGAARATAWLTEADARAESPLETRVRLRAADGGLPPDELQYRVRTGSGEVVAIADFAWLRSNAGVIGEADGVDAHDNPTALFRDRRRQNEIIVAGYDPIRFTWEDTLDPGYVPHTVRQALRRRTRREP
jgi:hypothetical protein